MAAGREDQALVRRIIKRHGAVIDLERNPQVIIDILRVFGARDGGLPPGGVPDPPPGPTSRQDLVTMDDVMKQLLKVSRDVARIRAKVGAK